jgi:ECF sigma factor
MNAEPSMSESPEREVTSLLQAWGKVLDVSVATVHRDWQLAKVWLMRELSKENRRGA